MKIDAGVRPISPAVRSFLSAERKMLIGDRWTRGGSGRFLDVCDPANGKLAARVPAAGREDVDKAVKAARSALDGVWGRVRPADRERMLWRLSDLIERNADELAEIVSIENGKSVKMARFTDVAMSVDYFRYMAGHATKIEGAVMSPSFAGIPSAEYHAFTTRAPVGVVAQIIPWNFPLLMAAWKIAPALAAGCAVVLKPAEETPLSTLRLGELALEAGFPAGALNIVTGDGEETGSELVRHPGVDKVAFTGSTSVGREIARACADRIKRVSLELGGKSPVVVLDDADPAAAINGAIQAIFFNHGQTCTAGSRLYVAKKIYDEVVSGLASAAAQMTLGPGWDDKADMGPLVSRSQRDRVMRYIDIGRGEGAELLAGGESVDGPGSFVRPTVFGRARQEMRIVCEEIFGPVISAIPFTDESEIPALANHTEYGLAASVWTKDLSKAHRLASRIRAGTVWVNCHNIVDPAVPFGGFKMSGIGREHGSAAIDLYTEAKTVWMLV